MERLGPLVAAVSGNLLFSLNSLSPRTRGPITPVACRRMSCGSSFVQSGRSWSWVPAQGRDDAVQIYAPKTPPTGVRIAGPVTSSDRLQPRLDRRAARLQERR